MAPIQFEVMVNQLTIFVNLFTITSLSDGKQIVYYHLKLNEILLKLNFTL